MASKLTGWIPDPQGVEDFLNDAATAHPLFGLCADDLMGDPDQPCMLLHKALLSLQPDWKRGRQGIGDCVSWGWELACSILSAVDIVHRREPESWQGCFATEPIYGGSRVEARKIKRAGWNDGAYGGAAAKWVRDWGVIPRKNYSQRTNNSEHNLTRYSSKKAKQWGNYGCGGKHDKGRLDSIAREHPVETVSLVTSFDEAKAAIANGYPVPVCSSQGFLSKRDGDGFCGPKGTWSHCMVFHGLRTEGRHGLLITNSWGRSVSGPMWPDDTPDSIGACSWWVDADVVDRMLRRKDSYAISGYDGFKRRELKWDAGWL